MSFEINVVKAEESSGILDRIVEIIWTQMSFELNVVKSQESSGIVGRIVEINWTQVSLNRKNLAVF